MSCSRTWVAAFVGALVMYVPTGATHIQWSDAGIFAHRVATGQIVGWDGLARAHPLHVLLASGLHRALGIGSPRAVALVAALSAAIAVAHVALGVRVATGRSHPALWAASALAVSHTWWQMTSVGECYPLSVALSLTAAGGVWLWLSQGQKGGVLLAGAAAGLALANHNLALVELPVWGAALAWGHLRGGRPLSSSLVAATCIVYLVATLPFTALILTALLEGQAPDVVLQDALFGRKWRDQVLSVSVDPVRTLKTVAHSALSFPNLVFPLALVGIWRSSKAAPLWLHGRATWLLGALATVHAMFALRYPVPDQQTFVLAVHAVIAVFAGIGFGLLPGGWARRRWVRWVVVASVVITPAWYVWVRDGARSQGWFDHHDRVAFHDPYTAVFHPWAHRADSARRLTDHVIGLLGPGGVVIYGRPTGHSTLWYAFRAAGREDLRLIDLSDQDGVHEAIRGEKTVVYIPWDAAEPELPPLPSGAWRPADGVWRLER